MFTVGALRGSSLPGCDDDVAPGATDTTQKYKNSVVSQTRIGAKAMQLLNIMGR